MRILGTAMLAISVILTACAGVEQPQQPAVPEAFQHTPWSLSGAGWTELPKAQQTAYVMGVVDAWYSLKEGLPADYGTVKQCLERYKVSYEQMLPRVEAYLQGNPNESSKDMSTVTLTALHIACEKSGQK